MKNFFTAFLLLLATSSQSQLILIYDKQESLEISFEQKMDLILVELKLEGIPLKFIFDTGAENNILFHKELCRLLSLDMTETIMLRGSNLSDPIPAHIIRNIDIEISKLPKVNTDLIVLDQAPKGINSIIGEEIHGILGASFFRYFVVEVDYNKRKIKFHTSKKWNKIRSKKLRSKPIKIINGKAYLNMPVTIKTEERNLNFLIDSGASIHFLLHQNTFENIELPDTVLNGVIGAGISGHVLGYLGRIESFEFCGTVFENEIIAFQHLEQQSNQKIQFYRNGIIGNKLLQRYYWAIDYPHGLLYYKERNRNRTDREFKMDKSGMEIILGGKKLDEFIIHNIRDNSPATEIGLLARDKIIRFNGWPPSIYGIERINRILARKKGDKIRLLIKRGENKLKKQIILRDLI